MITTGVTGRTWRASVSAWGSIHPWDDLPPLDWYVAADDRWHVPAEEQSVRQRRIEGTAVVETRVRVPTGDVVHRIVSVADAGGLTVVEVENESTMPVAVAFDRRDLLTDRPIAAVPIEGIDLSTDAFVVPIGHRASVRVAIAHERPTSGPIPAGVSTSTQVVRGWLTLTERASRFALPDGERGAGAAVAVTAARCEAALGALPRTEEDPSGFVLSLGELVRMGERPDPWLPELVDAVGRLGPVATWEADVALQAAARVLAVADERRALRDLIRITSTRTPNPSPVDPPDDVRVVPWLETRLADGRRLLPHGLPPEWFGQALDVYGVPTGPASSVSYAIRWHGERPAVLWEQTGEPGELTAPAAAPGWSTREQAGEMLWPVPPGASTVAADSAARRGSRGKDATGDVIDVDDRPDSFT